MRLFLLATVLGMSGYISTTPTPEKPLTASGDPHTAVTSVPGMPNSPDLVTVVPFYWKADETKAEQTKVIIPAEVDGRHGNFVVDLGDPDLDLNRTYLRPSATGGIDTVLATDTTDTHRLPEWDGKDSVHVTLRIGTLNVDVVDPTMFFNPRHINAFLNHQFGNYSWVFAPRLGNIGLSALEPFETIFDYTHRRVVLIRLDKVGRRLVDVPAYTPKWSAPLIDIPLPYPHPNAAPWQWWGVQAVVGGVSDSMFFDTGDETNDLLATTAQKVAPHISQGALDSMVIAGRSFGSIPFEFSNPPVDVLGYPFLSQLGVVGFNHRTHQWLLYR